MINPREIKVLDINSEFLGVPAETLMENAGKAIADVLDRRFKEKEIAIICGTGNNAGDGFVAARHLKDHGWDVTVLLLKSRDDIKSQLAKKMLEAVGDGVSVIENAEPSDVNGKPIILDSMLGTGMKGNVREPYIAWILALNSNHSKIISVDVPSGLGADISVKPVMTVALHDTKTGMSAENSGEIIVKDIGIPENASRFVGLGEFAYYPIPKANSHKGQNGHVLVIGGGPYTGAPALAGMAAYASGADLVTLAVPENCFQVIASYSPMLIVRPLPGKVLAPEHIDALEQMMDNVDACIIGPGGGRDEKTLELFRKIIAACNKPMVIDADGLNSLSGHLEILKGKNVVLTPHKTEFGRLTGKPDSQISEEDAKTLAAELDVTIVLKGPEDVITNGTELKLNNTGNPAMTVGGTGDVLAGLIGGILSKIASGGLEPKPAEEASEGMKIADEEASEGMKAADEDGVDPYDAARMGTYLCGISGDMAFEEMGYSMTALDVIYNVPQALKECLRTVCPGKMEV